ncbi:MAG: hypothetical protein IPG70_03475 [Moraxellaceae bacterium]|nr:hypothetical protein [Moraxellaceae bacterium]
MTPRGRGKAARQVIQTVCCETGTAKSKHWITIVIAQEAHPKGSQAVVWRLITNRLVGDFLAACELINWYRKRWLIETFLTFLRRGVRLKIA